MFEKACGASVFGPENIFWTQKAQHLWAVDFVEMGFPQSVDILWNT
jgi:hypothetical protein